jgi:hypothetical protein
MLARLTAVEARIAAMRADIMEAVRKIEENRRAIAMTVASATRGIGPDFAPGGAAGIAAHDRELLK